MTLVPVAPPHRSASFTALRAAPHGADPAVSAGDASCAVAPKSLRRILRRMPRAALLGAGLAAAMHYAIVFQVGPHPHPHRMLRQKAAALTAEHRPSVLALGDSRAEFQICPDAVATGMNREDLDPINLAMANGDSSAGLAVYRAFAPACAPRPLALLSISFFSVNDHYPFEGGGELLASMTFGDRWRLFGGRAALASLFIPERSMIDSRLSPFTRAPADVVGELGFLRLDPASDGGTSTERIEKEWRRIACTWFLDPVVEGIRWQQTVKDITSLHELGAQIVLIDMPFHPVLERRLAGTPHGEALRLFQGNMDALAAKLAIPLLRYTSADLEPAIAPGRCDGESPPATASHALGGFLDTDKPQDFCAGGGDLRLPASAPFFFDLLHLNEVGALVISRRIGEDLKALLAEGRIVLHDEASLHRSADARPLP
ncbi:MAG: hypothetical protein IT449_09785 [Phycisphaerales bacterium]|nr:hypothetical protein [Phycisphaerales bacterium]